MDSSACELDDDEELAALIYQSSQTAKAFKARIAITSSNADDVNGGEAEDRLECEQSKNEVTDHDEQQKQEQQSRAASAESQQTLRRSTRQARARPRELGDLHNHDVPIEQKQQKPHPSCVGNGDRCFVRSSPKQSPTAHLLKSADMSEEVQLKMLEEDSAMAGGAPNRREHEQSSTTMKQVRPKCSFEGCTNVSQRGGICLKHGGQRKKQVKPKCTAEGCTNFAQTGGICVRHGAQTRRCSAEGCTNQAIQNGVCIRHGARTLRCSHEGCTSGVQKGGLCFRHGAKHPSCSQVGCEKRARAGGVLFGEDSAMAGGAPKRKKHEQSSTTMKQVRLKCSAEGCTNISQRGGICIKHGGQRKKQVKRKCTAEGCTNQARKKGVCVRHGAQTRRCSAEGCKNNVIQKGVCVRHGARTLGCSHEGCTSCVQKGGLCFRHGAETKR